MTVLAVLDCTLPSFFFCLSCKKATVMVLTDLAVSAVVAVSVVTATPLKLNPPPFLGCTPRGSCNCTLLRRVLRRFFKNKCFLEGFLEDACKGFR